MKGIDVSRYQGVPDWKLVRTSGVDFAMIKATQGRAENANARLFTDSQFRRNMENAPKAGLLCGVYHYLTAQNEAECDEEAAYFLSVIEPYRNSIALYAAVDVESRYLSALTPRALSVLVMRFCKAIQAAGFCPIVYTNPDWLRNHLAGIGDFPLWLALWRKKTCVPMGYPGMKIWQWGASEIAGIAGATDTDEGYFTLTEFAKQAKEDAGKGEPTDESLPESTQLAVGDAVRIVRPILYDSGRPFLCRYDTYTVIGIEGERVCVAHFGAQKVAVAIDCLEKL